MNGMRKHLAMVVAMVMLTAGVVSASGKAIRDPVEYDRYISALNMQDPSRRGAAMEAFFVAFPGSVMRIDALEQAMAAYQLSGDTLKVEQIANLILQHEPDNVRALAIVVFLQRSRVTQGDQAALNKLRKNGETGLRALESWSRPEGITDEHFTQLHNQMRSIFAGAVGFAALQGKDYAAARRYYEKSLAIDPTNLPDNYQLSIAELEMTPLESAGFWYLAKALTLAKAQKNEAGAQAIEAYGKAKYRKYHGSEQGWSELLASAAGQSAPPKGFTVKAAPTACELAVQAVEDNDPASLSFSDWEFILSLRDCSPAAEKAAQKVWQAIQHKQKDGSARLLLPVKVISATRERISAAITDENQSSNTADLEMTMERPLEVPPAAGSRIEVIGLMTGYNPNPFYFTMSKGELPEEKGTRDPSPDDSTKSFEPNQADFKVHYDRGVLCQEKGAYDQAISELSRSIELMPDFHWAYYYRGLAYDAQGKYALAISDYGRAIDLDPDQSRYTKAYVNRGSLYEQQGNLTRAIDDFSRDIELNPTDATAFFDRGFAYLRAGKYDLAIADYQQEIALDTANANSEYAALHTLVATWLAGKDATGPVAGLRRIMADAPSGNWVRSISRYVAGDAGMTAQALLVEARRGGDAKEVDERLCEAYFYLGAKLLADGNRKGAKDYLAKSVATGLTESMEYRLTKTLLERW